MREKENLLVSLCHASLLGIVNHTQVVGKIYLFGLSIFIYLFYLIFIIFYFLHFPDKNAWAHGICAGCHHQPPHGPFAALGPKIALAQLRTDFHFTFLTIIRNHWRNCKSRVVSPCMPHGSMARREWAEVTVCEQWLTHVGSKDLLFPGVSPSSCPVAALKARTSQTWRVIMCQRSQTDLKMLAENTSTLELG